MEATGQTTPARRLHGRDEATREKTSRLAKLKAERQQLRRSILAKQAQMGQIELFGVKSSQQAWDRLARETAKDMRAESRILREIARMEGRS